MFTLIPLLVVGLVAAFVAWNVIPKKSPSTSSVSSTVPTFSLPSFSSEQLGPHQSALNEKMQVVQASLREKHDRKFRRETLSEIKELLDEDE